MRDVSVLSSVLCQVICWSILPNLDIVNLRIPLHSLTDSLPAPNHHKIGTESALKMKAHCAA